MANIKKTPNAWFKNPLSEMIISIVLISEGEPKFTLLQMFRTVSEVFSV
jgi:hypothetical protein